MHPRSASLLVGGLSAAAALTVSMTACTGDGRPSPVNGADAAVLVLSELPFAELELPEQSRPGAAEPPASIPLQGPWRYLGTTKKGMHKYAMPVPVRPRGLFFNRPQPGMVLTTADGAEVRYDRFGKTQDFMWSYDRKELTVFYPEKSGPPDDGRFLLAYPKATARERALNQKWSGKSKEHFVWTTIQDDWDSRRGLLLPAPGTASWDVTLPPAAEFQFTSGLVEPEIRDGTTGSDGATVTVEVEVGGKTEVVFTDDVAVRSFESQHVDLSRWAGQQVRLRVRTDPKANAEYDYAFLAEPVIASRKADPVRVLMVFVDTLRPDHLSQFGYARDTSVALDGLAQGGVVFEQARSIAPWTLPSARTIVTGRHPEYYDATETLQERLRKKGWASAFFAGNVYLSVNFGMHRDWDLHRVGLWPEAEEVTNDALKWLDEHDGRDAVLQVHYMDPHLPYIEPPSYRNKYAGDGVGTLRDEFHLSDVKRARIEEDAEAQQYVKDRYDNNIRYATDQIRRLLDRMDGNDVVLFYSDHGEEFWDHQGFEHGHTLYDELLRVPLIVKAPGVKAGSRVKAPVSLLDLTPTVLDLVGEAVPPELDGRSLAPLLRGEAGAEAAFEARDQAFGRPLYGMERWGVLHDHKKWTTSEGRESLYDLNADAAETDNLLKANVDDSGAPYREYMSKALGRRVEAGYRLTPTAARGGGEIPGLWAMCTVPGGFEAAWKGDDPLQNSEATVRLVDDPAEAAKALASYQIEGHAVPEDGAAAEICWHPGWFGSREVYLVPKRPLAEVGREMVCSAYLGDEKGGTRGTMSVPENRDPALVDVRIPLNKIKFDARQLVWQYGIAPQPGDDTQALEARDSETNEMLEAMGYVDPEKPEGQGDAGPSGVICHPPTVKLAPQKAP